MFDHLDDPDPHSLGTDHQLAAARNRGRELARHSRRNRLAVGSAAVAATAGVTAAAVVGLPGRSASGATTSADTPSPLTASPTAAPVPALTASPAPVVSAPATPESSTVAPTVPTLPDPTNSASPVPLDLSQACAALVGAIKTTDLPAGFTPLVPPSGLLSWSHVGAPINAVVVTASCAPFDPSQVPSGTPVKEHTVLGAHSWLVGDPASGSLQLSWNPSPTTSVTLTAAITLPEQTGQVEDQLLTLGNMIVD
jgi:hypothetical protein